MTVWDRLSSLSDRLERRSHTKLGRFLNRLLDIAMTFISIQTV